MADNEIETFWISKKKFGPRCSDEVVVRMRGQEDDHWLYK